uniref:Multivesicular body subunit 12A n=1 Tax=Acrobeloides nanus TaxID=290746 RepID=A0A914EM61_9BILA
MGEENVLPIVSICIIADRNKGPPGFTPILKTHDESIEADIWKEGWGIFNRTVRYLAISRQITADTSSFEVVNDIAIIEAKEAVPNGFTCVDFTADSKEKALRKKYFCVRFLPRNDAVDAVTDIIVLSKNKRPPKGYTSAGDIDGLLICFKQTPIAETYGRLPHSKSNPSTLYPSIGGSGSSEIRHSTSDISKMHTNDVNAFTIKTPLNGTVKGIDGVPFKLNAKFANALTQKTDHPLPEIQDPRVSQKYIYNFSLERSIVS